MKLYEKLNAGNCCYCINSAFCPPCIQSNSGGNVNIVDVIFSVIVRIKIDVNMCLILNG
jgi:hypothetical protein